MRARSRLLAFVMVLWLGGCAPVAPSPTATPLDVSGDWELESGLVDGRPIPMVVGQPITLTLTLDEGRIGGVAACNHYGADVTTDGRRFGIGTVETTRMACEPPVMAAQSAYLEALARVAEVHVEGDQLVLAGPATMLRFERPTGLPGASG